MQHSPREPYPLSDAFRNDLRRALGRRSLPEDFEEGISWALHTYKTINIDRLERQARDRCDAVQRLHKDASALQKAVRRLNAAFVDNPRDRVIRGARSPITTEAHAALSAALAEAIQLASRWLTAPAHRPRKRAKGRAVESRSHVLRTTVFEELTRAKVPLTKNSEGVAAQALAAVLQEADRIDGVRSRPRDDFGGKQWGQWLNEHHELARLATLTPGLTVAAVAGLEGLFSKGS